MTDLKGQDYEQNGRRMYSARSLVLPETLEIEAGTTRRGVWWRRMRGILHETESRWVLSRGLKRRRMAESISYRHLESWVGILMCSWLKLLKRY